MTPDELIAKRFRIKFRTYPPFMGMNDITRDTIYSVFNELGYKKGAEIGVDGGRNAKKMFHYILDLQLILVDPWKAYRAGVTPELMEQRYQECRLRLKGRDAKYIKKTSIEAVKEVEDGSLDFVYIDGVHGFDNVMTDLIFWSPKVRKGGIVSGHDFYFGYYSEVVPAVTAYTYAHNITTWYITSKGIPTPTSTRERPSYLWVK